MEIILDTNLKLILKNLNIEQKGKLFDMLLEQKNDTTDEEVKNFYEYIEGISIKKQIKKDKMKTLGLLGSAARWKKTPPTTNSNINTTLNSCGNNDANSENLTQRKETKENNNLNNINNFILSNNLDNKTHKYKIPTLEEVEQYIKANSFNVDAENFIDFYESRGWCVGKSEIKNWQATIRMWHRRSISEAISQKEDEQYWHQLKEKYWTHPKKLLPDKSSSKQEDTLQTYPELSSHFTRFIKRIEDNDLTS